VQQFWKPTTLILIRHAQAADRDSEGNVRMCGWLDVPLTPHGQQQAECLPSALARFDRIAGLYTSSLQRAVDTALPIARGLGIEPRVFSALREISCGDLEGLPVAEVKRRYPRLWQANLAQNDDAFCWPGGESYRLFRVRVLKALAGSDTRMRAARLSS
jgi:broad specificity phosphatase PhoE